jgi:hypothetical protein
MQPADAAGTMDASERGDPPGFVRVLDDTTLAIPEGPGRGNPLRCGRCRPIEGVTTCSR